MKRKRTEGLSCERARAFPIERALAKLGHFPTKSTGKEAWFLSPFRSEAQASFKVSKRLNRWYDHGAGKGGNVIDLVCQINECPVSDALKLIAQDRTSFSFQQQPVFGKEETNGHKITVTDIRPLTHHALKGYLKSRNIEPRTASKFCNEVHYQFKDKSFFAIGLENDSRGWELRNKYYKNSASPKDSTHIKNGNQKLIVTEGMFDFLSIMELNPKLDLEYDFLVLNSAAFIKKALHLLEEYDSLELYLDHDGTGSKLTKKLMAHSKKYIDRSGLYIGHKDMNERIMADVKNDMVKGRQDVFL